MSKELSKQVVKKINGMWSVVSDVNSHLVKFKSLSRKTAQDFADEFNAACAVPLHSQLNASVGVSVWRPRNEA